VVIVFLGALTRLFGRWRPEWTRPFIIEYAEEAPEVSKETLQRPIQWIVALFSLTILGLAASIAQLVLAYRDISSVFLLTSWMLTALIIGLSRPRTSPAYLLAFYLSAFCVELLNVLSAGVPSSLQDVTHYIALASAFAAILVILDMRLRDPSLPNTGISVVGDAPSNKFRSPEDDLRLWQFLSISWMFPLIRIGKMRTLNQEDVWFLAYEFQHGRLFEKFSSLSGPVMRRLIKANGLDICILTLSSSTETVCRMYTKHQILRY
jgi:hypothetical protein